MNPMGSFAAPTNNSTVFGGTRYLWGNVPAFDVMNLGGNEGLGFEKDCRLLFAGKFPAMSLSQFGADH